MATGHRNAKTTAGTTRPANGGSQPSASRRPTGNGGSKPSSGVRPNSRNGISFWPVELISSGPLDLTLEGQDGDDFGLAICGRCSAVIPGSDRARQAHAAFHETVDAIDQRSLR